MDVVTKHTPHLRRALGIGSTVLVFCLFAYWILGQGTSSKTPRWSVIDNVLRGR